MRSECCNPLNYKKNLLSISQSTAPQIGVEFRPHASRSIFEMADGFHSWSVSCPIVFLMTCQLSYHFPVSSVSAKCDFSSVWVRSLTQWICPQDLKIEVALIFFEFNMWTLSSAHYCELRVAMIASEGKGQETNVTSSAKTKSACNSTIRSFQKQLLKLFPWVRHDKEQEVMFFSLQCMWEDKQDKYFFVTGCPNFRKSRLEEHITSTDHKLGLQNRKLQNKQGWNRKKSHIWSWKGNCSSCASSPCGRCPWQNLKF